mgnify:CR=1 FL=1
MLEERKLQKSKITLMRDHRFALLQGIMMVGFGGAVEMIEDDKGRVGFLPAVPSGVEFAPPVLPDLGVAGIVARGVKVIIPVLVVDGEDESEGVTGVGETLHPLPAAGLGARRQDVGMEVVVAAKAPAVEVDIGPPDAQG